jgi:Protein of unknown function (DUF4236)
MSFLPGFRFRKSISILPGVKFNISKGGVSTSVGGKGATVNLGTKTQSVNVGIPGTGMSYKVPLSGSIAVLAVLAAIVVGIAWLIAPDMVRAVLHLWQPKWF